MSTRPFWQNEVRRSQSETTEGRYHLVPILCFHNVDGVGVYSVSVEKFRGYLDTLKHEGVEVVPLRSVYRHSVSNRLMPRPSVAITIDDDYVNIARVAAPILREYGYPATFFVYTQDIQKDPRGGMSWEDLQRLRREGFDIQNHSYSHTKFHEPDAGESPQAYAERVRREILESRKALVEALPGLDAYAFAYPMGYYSNNLRDQLFQAGYRLLLTTDAAPVDLTKPFTGTLHRHTIQKPVQGVDPDELFRLQIAYAKRLRSESIGGQTATAQSTGPDRR